MSQQQAPPHEAHLPTVPYAGTAYRLIKKKYKSVPLSTVGSLKKDGRYHKRGAFPILYLGLSPKTCFSEIRKALSHDGSGLFDDTLIAERYALCSYRVSLEHVVNLTDPATLSHLGVDNATLTTDDYTPTQALGQRLYDAPDPKALLAPSARHTGGQCLDVFMTKAPGAVTCTATTERFWPDLALR
jgi:RES domain-containing protein